MPILGLHHHPSVESIIPQEVTFETENQVYKEINDIIKSEEKRLIASSHRSSSNNVALPPRPIPKRRESVTKVPIKYMPRRKMTSTEMLNNFITNKLPDFGAN